MMATARRVTKIRPSWIHAMLIGKGSLQDEDFLSTWVGMGWKRSAWRIPYDTRHQAERFIAHQIAPFDAWRWGRFPREIFGLEGNGLGEVGTQWHGDLLGYTGQS